MENQINEFPASGHWTRRGFIGTTASALCASMLDGCAAGNQFAERVGVCSWSFRLPLDKVATEMRIMGLKRIHLALQPFLEGNSRHGSSEDAKSLDRVKARLDSGEWKLSAAMIGFPQEDYSTLETIRKTGGVVPDDCWEANKKIVKAGAKLAAELKAPLLTLHAGFLDEKDKVAYQKYSDRVKFIADTCGEAGVGVAFETGQETAEDLAKFLSTMKGVGVNFDPANMILYGKGDPVEAVKVLAPWMLHIHIKDGRYTTKPGTWGEETPWGEGDVHPAAFFRALDAVKYGGAFAIEREGGDKRVEDIRLAAKRLLG